MTPSRVLAAFAFWVAALDLGFSRGLAYSVGSPAGMAFLALAAVLLAVGAVRTIASDAPLLRRIAGALVSGGGALLLAAIPASLAMRETREVVVGEGQDLPSVPGLAEIRFGRVTVAPSGPHILSKTVSIEAFPGDGPPVSIGLFPPTSLGSYRLSVVRYGYAPGISWLGADGTPIARGWVMLGNQPKREEDAALVEWTPEPNVMMGAGTFPPKLEDLLSPEGTGAHLFVRLDQATIAGAVRDLRDPDAYRWLADARLEHPVFFAQAFRGKEKVFDGRVRGGEAVRFPRGGELEMTEEMPMWVDLLAVRDPWVPWAGAGLAAMAVGLALRAGLAAASTARRLAAR